MGVFFGGYFHSFSIGNGVVKNGAKKSFPLPTIGEIELIGYKEAIARASKITSGIRKFFREKPGRIRA